jgi:hypothetical protein
MFISHIRLKLASFFRAHYGRMVRQKFFKDAGSMWVGGSGNDILDFSKIEVIPSAEFSLVGQCPAGRECTECSLPLIRQ